MVIHRVSCVGRSVDSYILTDDVVFWVTDIFGIWYLMYRTWVTLPDTNEDVLTESVSVPLGSGLYRGIDVVKALSGTYRVIYSLDYSLQYIHLDTNLHDILRSSALGRVGYYPVVFKHVTSEEYCILSQLQDKTLVVDLTTDFVSFDERRSVTQVQDSSSYVTPNSRIPLDAYIEFQTYAYQHSIGHEGGYLDTVV